MSFYASILMNKRKMKLNVERKKKKISRGIKEIYFFIFVKKTSKKQQKIIFVYNEREKK